MATADPGSSARDETEKKARCDNSGPSISQSSERSAFLSIAPAASRRAAHSSRTRARHAPPHNAAAQGLEVSLRHIPQYLLLYRQLRH